MPNGSLSIFIFLFFFVSKKFGDNLLLLYSKTYNQRHINLFYFSYFRVYAISHTADTYVANFILIVRFYMLYIGTLYKLFQHTCIITHFIKNRNISTQISCIKVKVPAGDQNTCIIIITENPA